MLGCALVTIATFAQDNSASTGADDEKAKAAALAKATLNPIASLISVPVQNNFDWGAGPNDEGFQYKLTVQPVIPISLNENWNVISRTIVPFVDQDNYIGSSSQSGLADTVQSLFFSPVKAGPGGWMSVADATKPRQEHSSQTNGKQT